MGAFHGVSLTDFHRDWRAVLHFRCFGVFTSCCLFDYLDDFLCVFAL